LKRALVFTESFVPNRIKWLIYLAAITAVFIVLAYFYNFHSGFSKVQSDWGSFGSYLGGTLGAAFAFLAFLAGLENLRFIKGQQEKEEVLVSVKSYEADLKDCYSMIVTCEQPWIWGHNFDAANDIKELPLRTLLASDSIDWKAHLEELRDSLAFRKQPNSELFQDRDIWLMAYNAAKGLFRFIDLYESVGGDSSIVSYYRDAYEIPYNRLLDTSR
jgi:hypothetical protein